MGEPAPIIERLDAAIARHRRVERGDDDGLEEVRGQTHRVRHTAACDGWILDGFTTLSGERVDSGAPPQRHVYAGYRPCEQCSPGAHAAWAERNLRRRDLSETERLRVFVNAERAAGRDVTPEMAAKLARLERKAAVDRAASRDAEDDYA